MRPLNYHHLRYFQAVAKAGSISRAADALHLTPQTVSEQLRTFEDSIGAPLFDRRGRRLALNPRGRRVLDYADAIFELGDALQQALEGEPSGTPGTLSVGVIHALPKILAYHLIEPCLQSRPGMRLAYREGSFEELLAQLEQGELDVVLADRPPAPASGQRALGHLLGESGLSFYSTPAEARTLSRGFPASLHRRPFLISGSSSSLRPNLQAWFQELAIEPELVAEFDDSSAMKFFGQAGLGVFCTPSHVEQHVLDQYRVRLIGRIETVSERFYAITPPGPLEGTPTADLVAHARQQFGDSALN